MNNSDQIEVFNFWASGDIAEAKDISHSKLPREVIINELKAKVVQGTGQMVLKSELDSRGRYRRIATGWGAVAPVE